MYLCVYRCPTLTWKRPPSSPSSRRNWPSCQVTHTHTHTHTNYEITCVSSVRGLYDLSLHACLVCNLMSPVSTGLFLFRGQRPAQWSDLDHPSQFRSDQHGGAQRHAGLSAQHSQVHTDTQAVTGSSSDILVCVCV